MRWLIAIEGAYAISIFGQAVNAGIIGKGNMAV
jgi:hypothetical protein